MVVSLRHISDYDILMIYFIRTSMFIIKCNREVADAVFIVPTSMGRWGWKCKVVSIALEVSLILVNVIS